MEYTVREYPLFSACGLNCGLCPRHHTDGASRCPGCAGAGFLSVHPTCGVLTCCQKRGLAHCFACGEYPCKKYQNADASDSFISHQNQLRDMERAKTLGMDAYQKELDRKIEILTCLLRDYNDGRRKNFYCIAVNLLPLADLELLIQEIRLIDTDVSEKAKAAVRLLQKAADARGIPLKLRKKDKGT